MSKTIIQFGYKNSNTMPKDIPLVDCRVLRNPYIPGVADDILKEKVKYLPGFGDMVKAGVFLLRTNDTIGIGCLYGKHRSGAVAESIAKLIGAKIIKV